MSDRPTRPQTRLHAGRVVSETLPNADAIMRTPLWDWVNDWVMTGASSTMDVFTGIGMDNQPHRIMLIGLLVDSSPNDLVDQLVAHLANYCRDQGHTDMDAAFPPAKLEGAPSSNTGPTASDAPTSAREMWGYPPNIGHIPPGAGDD